MIVTLGARLPRTLPTFPPLLHRKWPCLENQLAVVRTTTALYQGPVAARGASRGLLLAGTGDLQALQ